MNRFTRPLIAGAALFLFSAQSAYAQAAFTVKSATTRKEVSMGGGNAEPHAHGKDDGHDHGHEHNADGRVETVITIVWKSAIAPTAIFYRPDAAHWLKCRALKTEQRPFGGGPNDYAIVERRTGLESFKKGEEYLLRPEQLPSEVQPNEVKGKATGAIFYQMGSSTKWQVMKVKMTKLPDLRRP